MTNSSGGEWSEAVPAILVIDAQAPSLLDRHDQLIRFNRNSRGFARQTTLPDIRALEMVVNRSGYGAFNKTQQPRDMEILRRVANTPRLELLPPAELPNRWIGLTCFDLIIISHDDFLSMAARQKPQFQALVDWTATGGNLLVFGQGDEYERLNATEKLLALAPLTRGKSPQAAGWERADHKQFHDGALRTYQMLETYGRYYGDAPERQQSSGGNRSLADVFRTSNPDKFLHRPLGMGLVLAMATTEPFSATTTEWGWILNTVGESRAMWYRRHGMSLRRQNNDYWEFLVPNTGKAPVFVFCALITLFAVMIGPVNYFVLARQRRLYLLLVTIPGGAALVTLCLVAYAVLGDGLGTQVRVRGYTLIDQNNGRAVNWSRQSYYSGIAPSRGMLFPTDTAVYTLEQFPPHEETGGNRRQKVFRWHDQDGQNLRKGYLTSRVTSQLLTLRTGQSTAAVQLDQRNAPTSLRNQLGGNIKILLLCDSAGAIFVAEDVPAGEKVSLSPADFGVAKEQLLSFFKDAHPARPEGLTPSQFEGLSMGQWHEWNLIDSGLSAPRMITSRLEDRLRFIKNVEMKDFPKATYIAIVDSSSETPLGVRSREVGSLHLIEGKF